MTLREVVEAAEADERETFALAEDTELTDDAQAVPAGQGTYVLGMAGKRIPLSLAQRLGLARPDGEPALPAVKQIEQAAEDTKHVSGPERTKSGSRKRGR